MNRSREYAIALLAKARDDLYVLDALAARPGAPAWVVGFHAQQAAEKAVKAVLAASGREFPRTHNLAMLLDLLSSCGGDTPPDAADLPLLTPYGTAFRYDQADAPESLASPDVTWAAEAARRTVRWAGRRLGVTEAPSAEDSG